MELIERVARAIFRAGFHADEDSYLVTQKWDEWPEERARCLTLAKAAIRAMLDGVDVDALRALLALAPTITLRQAVDAGVDEALGWDPYALKEGADPQSPAMVPWKVDAARKSLDALKEALGDETA